MQSRLLVFSSSITPRLRYIAEELLCHIGGLSISFTSDKNEFITFEEARINYSGEPIAPVELWIIPADLLFENDIRAQDVPVKGEGEDAVLFPAHKGDLDFDIFAAAFYLLSRYEEYLPFTPDLYGRYNHEESIAWRYGFLQVPLVEVWMEKLRKALSERFSRLAFHAGSFQFIPTYDVDMAYSYLHKGWMRNAGGVCLSLLSGDLKAVKKRIAVLAGKSADPFDAWEWLHTLHRKHPLQPVYFFLVALQRGDFDKNIPPGKQIMKELISSHSRDYTTGVHPSWKSGDDDKLLAAEIKTLEDITGEPVINSRQHFLRMTLPVTYERLIQQGITHDFSMGYAGMNGFRASVSRTFRWYHLGQEKITGLHVQPFCFMDATAYYYQKLSPGEGYAELTRLHDITRKVNGTMMTIWHNDFLGTGGLLEEWRKTYALFLSEIVYGNA